MTLARTHHRTRFLVTVLQILVLLAAITLASSGMAAANSGSDWLKPAREALSVARQTLQSFDPGAGNTEELDPWDRVLAEIRLNAQNCVDARLQAIEKIKGTLKPADASAPGATPAPEQQTNRQLDALQAEMNACQSVLLEARTLGDQIRSARENLLKFRLLGRGPDIWSVALAVVHQMDSAPGAVQAFLDDRLQVKRLQADNWMLLGILSTLAVALGLWWRRRWRQRLMQGGGRGSVQG